MIDALSESVFQGQVKDRVHKAFLEGRRALLTPGGAMPLNKLI
jgi:hypothetical protein